MKPGVLQKVKKLVEEVKVVYVATANKRGAPHIAASEGMAFLNKDQIVFRAWFCLKTIQNLKENPKLTLAVLNPKTQAGYQLTGEIDRIEKGAMLDGLAPGREKKGLPQAEHQLFIRIQEISELTSGPHSDEFLR